MLSARRFLLGHDAGRDSHASAQRDDGLRRRGRAFSRYCRAMRYDEMRAAEISRHMTRAR